MTNEERPREKLYEGILTLEDVPVAIRYRKMFVSTQPQLDPGCLGGWRKLRRCGGQ